MPCKKVSDLSTEKVIRKLFPSAAIRKAKQVAHAKDRKPKKKAK